MTKRELGREYIKKANKLYGKAFDSRDNFVNNKNEIIEFWNEVANAFEEKRIFKCDMEQVDKTLKQACDYIAFRKKESKVN